MNSPRQEVSSDANVPILNVNGLSVSYSRGHASTRAVNDVSFHVGQGEIVALVGESGSGKSTTVQTIIDLLPSDARIEGTVNLAGHEFGDQDRGSRTWESVRRAAIGYIPQDPQSSLDPTAKIGRQLAEIVRIKEHVQSRGEVETRVLSLLSEAGIDDPKLRAGQYPHELSGGLKQRVLIAAALVGDPSLIVADEPTSALDVTVQKVILDKIQSLVVQHGLSMLMVTHDLAVASDRAERILVMERGRIVEQGGTEDILVHPTEPYTKRLISSAPAFDFAVVLDQGKPADSEIGPADSEPAVVWHDVSKRFDSRVPFGGGARQFLALDKVSLEAPSKRTLAIVGESGSGKSTLLRIALGLIAPSSGDVRIDGVDVNAMSSKRLRQVRQGFQLVQQNPYESLDGRMTVERIIDEPLRAFRKGDRKSRHSRVAYLLEKVQLPEKVLSAKPHELSGGQCQRVAIARALAVEPHILLLDEPVSALDVTVQAQILELMDDLQRDMGLTYVFVSHDLSVVAMIAHRIAVLNHGRLVESGEARQVLSQPRDPYTQRLLDSVPGKRHSFVL